MRSASCLDDLTLWATLLTLTQCPLVQTSIAAAEQSRIKIETTDRCGDPLPNGAIARLGTARLRNGSWVRFVAFLPDGKRIVAAGLYTIRLWDVTGKEIRRFECKRGQSFDAMALSSDGKLLVAAENDEYENEIVHLWDLRSGKELSRSIEHLGIQAIAFAPDGRRFVAGGTDGVIRIWNVQTMNIIRELRGHQQPVRAFAFFPNGESFISGSDDHSIRIWSIESGKQLHRVLGHEDEVTSVAVSKDGSVFASASHDGAVRLWRAEDCKGILSFQGHERSVLAVAFIRNQKNLTLSEDGTIRTWSLSTGKELNKLCLRDPIIPSALAISPNRNLLAIGDHRGLVRFWDMQKWKEVPIASESHEATIHGIVFSQADRKIFTVSHDSTFRSWNFNKGDQSSVARWDYSRYLVPSPDAQVLATLDSSPEGSTLTLLDAKRGTRIKVIARHLRHPHHIAFSNDLKYLACMVEDDSTDHYNIRIWNLRFHEPIATIPLAKGGDSSTPLSRSALSFAPDGRLLAHVNDAGTIRVWDPQNGHSIKSFKLSDRDFPYCLCFSPDSTLLIIGKSDGGVVMYEARTGKLKSTIAPVAVGIIKSITISSDGRFLATGDTYGDICVLEMLSGNVICRASGHLNGIACMSFSQDGKYLFTGSEDCTALVWELPRLILGKTPEREILSTSQLNQLWSNLQRSDPATAFRSYWTLVSFPNQTVAMLKEKLDRVNPVPADLIPRLIDKLESESFSERERAINQLADFGELVRPPLIKKLSEKPTLELRRRIEFLLDRESPIFHPDRLRVLRAIGVLEMIHTPEAINLLVNLSKGTPDSRVTQAACAALKRHFADNVKRNAEKP